MAAMKHGIVLPMSRPLLPSICSSRHLGNHPVARPGGMLRLICLLLLVGLPLTASANPPDSTWIGGLYDDGDFDNVAIVIADTLATVDTLPPVQVAIAPLAVTRVVSRPVAVRSCVPRESFGSRAPPLR